MIKTRHVLMSAGFAAAAGLLYFGDKAPGGEIAAPIARAPARISPSAELTSAGTGAESSAQTDPQILALLPRSHDSGPANQRAGGLFSSRSWQAPAAKAKVEPPPAPTTPPMPFVYLGKQRADGRLEVYLVRGDSVFTVREQSVIEGTYRIDSIKPPTLTMTYLPLNQTQQLSIGVTD